MASTLHVSRTRTNRFSMCVTLIPVLVAVTFCLSALALRTAQAARAERLFGQMSQKDAAQFALETVSRLGGAAAGTAKVMEIASLSASSVRRNEARLREWHVTCVASTDEYLVRINADTRRVFSVNRVVRRRRVPLTPERGAPVRLNREEAYARAVRYLKQAGAAAIADEGLQVSSGPRSSASSPDAVWLFSASRRVPGIGQRTVKVAVNAGTGALESLWNPYNTL